MFAFFDEVSNIISSVINFVVTLFEQLVNFFRILFTSFSFVIDICAALPLPIRAGCLCIVAVAVIYLIINR